MQDLVNERGLGSRIFVDSAGTIAYHSGEAADSRMRAAASSRGYDLRSRARQIQPDDLREFDLVIAMDHDNLTAIRELAETYGLPSEHVRLLGAFLDEDSLDDEPPDVPDPYYGGPRGFDHAIDMIETACPKILRHLLAETALADVDTSGSGTSDSGTSNSGTSDDAP